MRKIIALVFAVIIVFPLLLSALVVTSISTWMLDRQFYIDTLSQPQVYSVFLSGPMVEKLIISQLNLPVNLNDSELQPVMQDIFTPQYVQAQVSMVINTLFDYLQGKTDTFTPTLDITPLKAALQGDQQDAFLTVLFSALPVCQPGQIPGFGKDGQTLCKPSGFSDQLLMNMVVKPALPLLIAALPDKLPLKGTFTTFQETSSWRSFVPGMAVPASIFLSLIILVCFAIFTWYTTALIADASWHHRLQWLGWMLLIPALLIFLVGYADQSGITAYWIRYGVERANLPASPFGAVLSEFLQAVAFAAGPRIMNAFKMVGGISIGVSLVLIFWGIATPKNIPEDII